MFHVPDSPLDRLWQEYSLVFRDFDDLSLARWLAQTLGQLQGRCWRLSHPLIGAYRLAAQLGHDRQTWLKRLATPPLAYSEAACCRAPLLPLFTRDIRESGLVCLHCAETALSCEDLPAELQSLIQTWASDYEPVHAVAHWDDRQRKSSNYEQAFQDAGRAAQKLLVTAHQQVLPKFLDFFPAIVWEDQDECLEIRPEDIETRTGNDSKEFSKL